MVHEGHDFSSLLIFLWRSAVKMDLAAMFSFERAIKGW